MSAHGWIGMPAATACLVALAAGVGSAAPLLAQATERVSISTIGSEANGPSRSRVALSADGRFVAFASEASNLSVPDTEGALDVFLHDRQINATTRESVDSGGAAGYGDSAHPTLSADGWRIAFQSHARDLVPGDTNDALDVFFRDRVTGRTTRVSVSSQATEGDSDSGWPSLSADGRYVAFESVATNLVPGDTNGVYDVFVHDRQTGVTERISVSSSGAQAAAGGRRPCLSADGRFVVFESASSDLVPGDRNRAQDIFVHDRLTAVTSRVSVGLGGAEPTGSSLRASCSADGRYVAFESAADNLVTGDTNGFVDGFVVDRLAGSTVRVTVGPGGSEANAPCTFLSMAANGRSVAFSSTADNLVSGDRNGWADAFVHDLDTGTTTRVSRSSAGAEALAPSFEPGLSADGRFVGFTSLAPNLIGNDTNGLADTFVRDRGFLVDTTGSIVLSAPFAAPVGLGLHFDWAGAPIGSDYWLAWSRERTGSVFGGHSFDLQPPIEILTTGAHSLSGIGSFDSPPVPAAAAGSRISFELAARDQSGRLYDSNAVEIAFH